MTATDFTSFHNAHFADTVAMVYALTTD